MSPEEMMRVSFGPEELARLKHHATMGRSYTERVSLMLAIRLLSLPGTPVSYFSVLDELDYLEGCRPNSKTKKETPFRHPPLAPFWHKHFADARQVPRNIGIRWGLDRGGNRDLDRLISDVAKEYGDQPGTWVNALTYRLVMGGFEDRARSARMTGDWIIFAKHEGQNYYLDLASHEEGEEPNAQALFEKLRHGCEAEFPFLFP